MSQSWLDKMAAQHAIVEEEEEEEEDTQEIKQATPIPSEKSPETVQNDQEDVSSVLEQPDIPKSDPPITDTQQTTKTSKPAFEGRNTKEIGRYMKYRTDATREQETVFVDSLMSIRRALKVVLDKTSAPLQNSGPIGKASIEAKVKYDHLSEKVLQIRPMFAVCK